MNIMVIFPGWASTKKLYENLKINVDEFLYADTFDLMKVESRLKSIGYETGRDKIFVLSWSMGTLQAQKFISQNWVDKLILVSPTSEFCMTISPVAVRKMIRDLKRNREQCLREFLSLNFYKQNNFENYINNYFDEINELNQGYLEDGLKFLLNEKIEEYQSLNSSLIPLVIIGKNDLIISSENSMNMVEKIPGEYIFGELICGHNVLYEEYDEVIRLIRGYLNDN